MSMVQLEYGQRKARKPHRCSLCAATIAPGDLHAFQVNVYDGRVYTWRTCVWCESAGVLSYVHDWTGGWNDEGVDYEQAAEWAPEAALFAPKVPERTAARNWLARAARAIGPWGGAEDGAQD